MRRPAARHVSSVVRAVAVAVVVALVGIGAAPPIAAAAVDATGVAPFADDDFDFALTPPPGMHRLLDSERASLLVATTGLDEATAQDRVRNRPRTAHRGAPLEHHHIWMDAVGDSRRQVHVTLSDGGASIEDADALTEVFASRGLDVDRREPLADGALAPGLRLEGTWRAGDVTLRKIVVCLVDPEGERYVLLHAQARADAWHTAGAEFERMLESIRFDRTVRSPMAALEPRSPDEPRWTDLEVWASFVLASVFLAHLALERAR